MDHPTYRCRIIDAFKLEGGRITRDAETESWRELLDPVIVDIDSGVVQLGAQGTPVQWEILQRGGPGWDFSATKSEPGNTVLTTIRIRLWETTVQMVLTVNGFTFATGICEPSGRETRMGEDVEKADSQARDSKLRFVRLWLHGARKPVLDLQTGARDGSLTFQFRHHPPMAIMRRVPDGGS